MMQLFTPLQYSKIAVANSFGLDKEDWNDRLDWFDKNQHDLPVMIRKADEPAMFFAAMNAYVDIVNGKPSGFPISLDATASGIQILSCLTGDSHAAKICNVLDAGKRMDAYQYIYDNMCERIGEEGTIDRKETKRALMTSMYASRAVPEEVFGTGELLKVFYETNAEELTGPYELNNGFLALWDNRATEYNWVLPDNYHVRIKNMVKREEVIQFRGANHTVKYKEQGTSEEGRSLGANTIHSIDALGVREITARCMHNPLVIRRIKWNLDGNSDAHFVPKDEDDSMVETLWNHYKECGFLSVRILDHLNQNNLGMVDGQTILDLLDTFPEKPFQVATNHDCFRVLPSYGNDIRKQYNRFLHDIAKSDLLPYLLKQITGRIVPIHKIDPDMYKGILDSNYSLS